LQSEKYRSQEVASNKLEKGPLRDYETGLCSPLALTVLEKKIFKDFTMFLGIWPKFDLEMKVKIKYDDRLS
jgi:DNA-binding MltR family transcriptional regulator